MLIISLKLKFILEINKREKGGDLLVQLANKTALFANYSPQFAIIGRWTGRPASSRHHVKIPTTFLPHQQSRCWCRFALQSFNPERAHPLSSKYLSLGVSVSVATITRTASTCVQRSVQTCIPGKILKVNACIFHFK